MTQSSIEEGSRNCAGTRVAPFGRRGDVPLRIGLAHRHQRHACHDGFQLEGRRVYNTVGRVQTPTLAILVEREDRIRSFKARDYWEIHARLPPHRVSTRPLVRRRFPEIGREARPERLWTRSRPRHPREMLESRASPPRSETGIAAFPSALRPHEPAARSERPLRLLGQDHASTGTGPV